MNILLEDKKFQFNYKFSQRSEGKFKFSSEFSQWKEISYRSILFFPKKIKRSHFSSDYSQRGEKNKKFSSKFFSIDRKKLYYDCEYSPWR